MWSHRLKAFKPSEKSIKKQLRLSGCCYVFWGANTATHWICLWISVLGCLSDEVMWVNMQRMGFSARTWFHQRRHAWAPPHMRFTFASCEKGKLVTGWHHPRWSEEYVDAASEFGVHVFAPQGTILPATKTVTLFLSSLQRRSLSHFLSHSCTACCSFLFWISSLALPCFHYTSNQHSVSLGDIFGINGHMITDQQVTNK